MADFESLQDLEDQIDALEQTMGQASDMAASFDAEMQRIRGTLMETGYDVATLDRGLSRGLRRAFDGVVLDGMKLSDALDVLAQSMINAAYNAAVKPVTDHVGGLLANGIGNLIGGLLGFKDGGSFAQGRVMPFASGGVVSSATYFPMRGGLGLMGEAGPEAIMPLSRGADGRLGVKAESSARPVNVVMNIQTPDAASFQRSQGQIAAQMGRALSRGQRNR
ncbi:MAG: phage tail tape measure protein [Paracoccaceae bacterium]